LQRLNRLIINHIGDGNPLANLTGVGAVRQGRSGVVKRAWTVWLVVALLLVGGTLGWASNADEAILTVQVTSADHELQEGYFTLGEDVTVMVKPGSELYRFLNRQRGNKVKIVLTEDARRELSTIGR
jgi:hypothetical protein